MAATDILGSLFRFYGEKISKQERILIEAIFFQQIYQELVQGFEIKIKNTQREDDMLDGNIINTLVNDLLDSEEYSVEGLASYTGCSEDVIYDLAAGINSNPTLTISTKIIELHFVARQELYNSLIKKILAQMQHA